MPAIGDRHGLLTLIERIGSSWVCRCACGKRHVVQAGNLPRTRSCGCAVRKHGEADKTPEYQAWGSMHERCNAKCGPDFENYGRRGIKVAEVWRDFSVFLRDVGRRPSPKHSIDRIENDKGYEPGNVRWATPREQARNKRTNRRLTYRGETATLIEWSERTGIGETTLHQRLKKYGWSVERALSEPVRGGGRSAIV
jgi:hypothetical protein